MQTKKFNEDFSNLSTERVMTLDGRNSVVADVFSKYDSLDDEKLYLAYFGVIPNKLSGYSQDKKAVKWLTENYKDDIKDCFYSGDFIKKKGWEYSFYHFVLFEDLLVKVSQWGEIYFYFRKTDRAKIDKLACELRKFKEREPSRLGIITGSGDGLCVRHKRVSRPKLSVENDYNDDFLPIHQSILHRLRMKDDKGLVLLHGKPGTGKTSYVRYLATNIKKQVIFLPPNMAASITDPELMKLLMDNTNSVFVIEDAENIIIDRNRGGSSSVSALLNLSDGLLSDCLNIQIICSFNTDISRIDNALMRKGRLIAKYEFTELETHKAQALSNKLGFQSIISEPMTLAQIYNQNETEFSPAIQRRSVGFNIAV
jgi:hypothetical protein